MLSYRWGKLGEGSEGSLCIIYYNCMWIYNYLKKKKKRVKGNWYSNGEANQLFGLGFICKDVHYNAVYSSKILHKLPKCLKTRNSFIIKIMVFFKINLFILFIYFWLHWVFTAVRGLSLVAVSRGYSSLWYAVFSLLWLLLLQSTGSRRAGFSSRGSQALEHRLSSCAARA